MPFDVGSTRRVVFHADDFGMNPAVNQGILTGFRNGLLTSTSLLSNAPAAESASQEWPRLVSEFLSAQLHSKEVRQKLDDESRPFDLGIHLNLTQGRPLSGERYPAELLDDSGHFPGIGTVFNRLRRAKSQQVAAVTTELRTQIEWMCDRGLKPSHLNGHQYVELIPAVAATIPDMLRRYSIPVVRVASETGLVRNVLFQGRIQDWGLGLVKRYYADAFRRRMNHANVSFPNRFFGTSHAGRIDLRTLAKFLGPTRELGITEIGVHPGVLPTVEIPSGSGAWFDPLHKTRAAELAWLCSAQLHDLLTDRGLKLGRLRMLTQTAGSLS